MLLVGLSLAVLGFLMTTKESVAEWGLSYGSGRLWVKLLGKERAMTVTKYCFGPLTTLLGIVAIVGAIATRHGNL